MNEGLLIFRNNVLTPSLIIRYLYSILSYFIFQNKDLELITENLLNLGFLNDTTQIDILIPRLRAALKNATGGTGKARDMNFAR